jgi:hypothetical protein
LKQRDWRKRMSIRPDFKVWRLQGARALAWALLLGGWVGLGGLAQTLATTPFGAFALLALGLLALGGWVDLIGRLHLPRWVLRTLLLVAALLTARAITQALHGGGAIALWPALLAWPLTVALASSAVRACRQAAPLRAGPPVGAAATGALLAWAGVGDITDMQALGPRLVLGVLAASVLLAALLPRRAGTAGACRAGLFDCSLPRWSLAEWRVAKRWPLLLAALVMLPMMCSLPLMVGLCRGSAVSPQAVLGLHFAAMFGPALFVAQRRGFAGVAPVLCAALLALGAVLLAWAPGVSAWWMLALAHGAAWSFAWAAQLNHRPGPTGRGHGAALGGAAVNALLVLALGAGLAAGGVAALSVWHIVLGVAGGLAGLMHGPWRRPRKLLAH